MYPMRVNGWRLFWALWASDLSTINIVKTVLNHKRMARRLNQYNEEAKRGS